MEGYIYLTTCLINGKKYIGQSINKRDINTYLGSGIVFKAALKKHGKENFVKEVLLNNITCIDELNKLEREYVSKYDCILPNGYNLDLGGTNKGRMSDATKDKIKNSRTGKYTEKQRIANIESHKGLKLLEATKKKIGDANRGRPSANKGKKMPKGHSDKMRKIMTGKIMNKKKIEILDTFKNEVIICDGIVDAASKLNVSNGMISLLNNGKIKHIKHRYYLVGALTLEAHPIASGVGG